MKIPRFNLTQDDNSVTITIRAPYCFLEDFDTHCDGNEFLFYCTPYHLRLNLPGRIVENANSKAKYEHESGEFTLAYGKETPGEHFPNLDLITSLLPPKGSDETGGRLVEVLGDETVGEETSLEDGKEEYGFALRGGYNFRSLQDEFSETFKINPHEVRFEDRKQLRLEAENNKFDVEHYEADLMDDEEIRAVIALETPWDNLKEEEIKFDDKELDFMKDLSNVCYNLTPKQVKYCQNSLIEILFAYCYDARTTGFEPTCESHWTITNISSSISWFDGFVEPKEALIAAYRRSLIFPYQRNFELCEKVFEDLKKLLALGEKFIVKCLIKMYNIFLYDSSGGYVINNLFIKDYIVYIMKWDRESWREVVDAVNQIKIQKPDLGLSIENINKEDLEKYESIQEGIGRMKIIEDAEDSDDTSEDEEEDSDDSSSVETCSDDSDSDSE